MVNARKQVLCVDDNRQMCEIVSSILHSNEVRIAFDIAGALALAAIIQFDLFILDFYLPDGTGFDLLQTLRQTHPETPAIFITTAADITTEDAVEMGALGLIHKAGGTFVNDLIYSTRAALEG
jgi:two-component system response regulator HydG